MLLLSVCYMTVFDSARFLSCFLLMLQDACFCLCGVFPKSHMRLLFAFVSESGTKGAAYHRRHRLSASFFTELSNITGGAHIQYSFSSQPCQKQACKLWLATTSCRELHGTALRPGDGGGCLDALRQAARSRL